jgi:hypothetical protein
MAPYHRHDAPSTTTARQRAQTTHSGTHNATTTRTAETLDGWHRRHPCQPRRHRCEGARMANQQRTAPTRTAHAPRMHRRTAHRANAHPGQRTAHRARSARTDTPRSPLPETKRARAHALITAQTSLTGRVTILHSLDSPAQRERESFPVRTRIIPSGNENHSY